MIKNKISLNIWLILSLIMILQGMLSTFSSYVYFLNTPNPVGYFQLLSQRIFSYSLWIVLIPLVYMVVTTMVKEKIKFRAIILLIIAGIFIAIIHRFTVILINDQFLSANPSPNFLGELMDQKYFFLSLCYDSFFSYALLVIFIQVYRISILRREAKLKEESFKKQLAQVELKNLKMKFQPHFIFNSLHSISAMAYKNPEIADSMISKLSELLRYSINSSDNNFTTVDEEIQLARKYIELQKLRFGSRIEYIEKVEPESLKQKMPLFVFQPLLENCIKHGVDLTDKSIRIVTAVQISEGKLEINITNTSFEGMKESDKSLGEGIQNLRERLDYIYDGNYKLDSGRNNESFSVTISLPLKYEE